VNLLGMTVVALCVVSFAQALNAAELSGLPDMPRAGSNVGELDRNIYYCEQHDTSLQCQRSGGAADHVGGEQAIEIVLFYRQGELVRSVVTFDEQRFLPVVAKLARAFGCSEHGSEKLNAGMGGTFENAYYVWREDRRVWLVEQFFQRISRSGLWIMNAAEFDTLMAERERLRVRGVRNL
jgi:hypothetical protein